MSNTTYHQKTETQYYIERRIIMKMIKRLKEQERDNYRNLSENDKNKKREIMEETDTIICLKKRKRISKKIP